MQRYICLIPPANLHAREKSDDVGFRKQLSSLRVKRTTVLFRKEKKKRGISDFMVWPIFLFSNFDHHSCQMVLDNSYLSKYFLKDPAYFKFKERYVKQAKKFCLHNLGPFHKLMSFHFNYSVILFHLESIGQDSKRDQVTTEGLSLDSWT